MVKLFVSKNQWHKKGRETIEGYFSGKTFNFRENIFSLFKHVTTTTVNPKKTQRWLKDYSPTQENSFKMVLGVRETQETHQNQACKNRISLNLLQELFVTDKKMKLRRGKYYEQNAWIRW